MRSSSVNTGSYDTPFSGVGIPIMPLGVPPGHVGSVLHEVGFLPKNGNWNFPGLFSPFWRLFHDLAKGHSVVIGNRRIDTGPDHWVLVPSYVRFDAVGDPPVPTLWLHFTPDRSWPEGVPAPLQLPVGDAERDLSERLRHAFSDAESSGDTDRIAMLGNAIIWTALSREELQWNHALPEAFRKVLAYLEANLGKKLSAPEIARATGMGVSTLHRFIKQHTGQPLSHFVNRLRTRHAADLLAYDNCNIETIAERLGFGDRSYFSRVFKKLAGQSPAEFRHLYNDKCDTRRQNRYQI